MNRNRIKTLAYLLLQPFSLKFLRQISGENFIFPFYHLVSDASPAHVRNLYPIVTKKQFLSDLEFLLKHYQPATITDVLDFVQCGKKSKKPMFFLSFDDGMRECYDVIYPVLKQKGIQAAFFINPPFVDNKELFYKHKISLLTDAVHTCGQQEFKEVSNVIGYTSSEKETVTNWLKELTYYDVHNIDQIARICSVDFGSYLEKEQPYMTTSQIKEMQSDGFIIGSHGLNHKRFSTLTDVEMKYEIRESMGYLKSQFPGSVQTFAFPFTDDLVPSSFFDFLYNEINLDITFGTAGIKKDVQKKHIQRVPMEVEKRNANQILRAEYSYFCAKSFVNRNTINRS